MGFPILFPFTSFRHEFLSQLLLIGIKVIKGHLGVSNLSFVFCLFVEGGEKETREKRICGMEEEREKKALKGKC